MIFVQVRPSGPRIESEIPSLGPDGRKAARGWPVFGPPAIRLPVLDEKGRPGSLSGPKPGPIRDTFVGPDLRKAARGWPVFGPPAIRLPVLDEKGRPGSLSGPKPGPTTRTAASRS